MHQLGMVCALTLSILSSGYQLEWDPKKGVAPPIHLGNHPSARNEHQFVSEAVAAGVRAGTMRVYNRAELRCILPLGVAINYAGKRRLIWDGRHVNAHLIDVPFKMETLQKEGRVLFAGASFGGTADVSAAYHHIEMDPKSIPYLGFEWEGLFYCFVVLPFGLSTAPRIFTTVMSHPVRFLRSQGIRILQFLDDSVFAHETAAGAR